MLKRSVLFIFIILALAGCSKSSASLPPTSAAATPPSVEINPTQAAFPSIPAVTPTSSASPTPYTPFTVKPAVDNLKIRVNPGRSFEALMMVQQTDELTVLGTCPGGEWTYIQTAAGDDGWVFSQLLQSSVNLAQVPVREPKNVQVVKGRVVDASGAPIQGVGFDISQGETAGQPSDDVAVTDANGSFFVFLPDTATGSWTVSYSSIACASSVWADTTCSTYKAGYTGSVEPVSQSVTLPQTGNPVLFTWR